MSFVGDCFKKILNIRLQSVFQIGVSCGNVLSSVSTLALGYLLPKQSVRPDSFVETFSEVTSKMRMNLASRFWKFSALFREHIPSRLGADYLNVLAILITQSSTESHELSLKEKQMIEEVFSQAVLNKNYLDKFDFFIAASQNGQIREQHNALKEIFRICNPHFFHHFKSKIQKLSQIKNIHELDPLSEEEKLTVYDINVLINVASLKPLLENLKNNRIKGTEEICSNFVQLEMLMKTPFFEDLKKLCLQSRPAGTIFLGDRRTFQALNGSSFDCVTAMQQLFMGRICHIGIFVNPEEKGLHLSHVNRMTKTHAVLPIKNPITLPFAYALTLDIRPLIPSHLTERKQNELIEIFFQEFHTLAQEEHPELPLAETKQHLKMLLFGHKSFYAQKLAEVTYPSKGSATMCSTYVGITFLKAVQKMNLVLEEQGFQERIPHPFGERENLMNMDILRLIYLLKELKLVKPSPISETLAKVIHSTSALAF